MQHGKCLTAWHYLFTFFEPLFQLVGFLTLLQNSISACERIIRLLDVDPSIVDKKDAIELDEIRGKIEYKKVNFQYEDNLPILNSINIKIKEKERAEQVRQAQTAGEVRADLDPLYLSGLIRAVFFQQMLMWHHGYRSAPLPTMLAKAVDLLLDGAAGPKWRSKA